MSLVLLLDGALFAQDRQVACMEVLTGLERVNILRTYDAQRNLGIAERFQGAYRVTI